MTSPTLGDSLRPIRARTEQRPVQRRLRNGAKSMSQGFKPNYYNNLSHKESCKTLLFGNCDCIPHLPVTIHAPYQRRLVTNPYWSPFESISTGVVMCTDSILYTPLSSPSIGPHLRLWTRHEVDIQKLHGQILTAVDEKVRSYAFLCTQHGSYGLQIWYPYDFITSCDIGEVRCESYDYMCDDEALMLNTLLVHQLPCSTAPDMLDLEAVYMIYRLSRLEDWSETSSLASSYDDVEFRMVKVKKEKDGLAKRIDFENEILKFRAEAEINKVEKRREERTLENAQHEEEMAQIEKVKKQREERAPEKAQLEEEMTLLTRERARAEFQDCEKKEEFHFYQSKMRPEIILREGLIKPIDVLSKHLDGSDDLDTEIDELYMVFKGLTTMKMEELRDDIKMHLGLDWATPTHIEYWEALSVVCNRELSEAWKKDAFDGARVCGEEPPATLLAEQRGLNPRIEANVKNLLKEKTYSQLEALQYEIESQMRSGSDNSSKTYSQLEALQSETDSKMLSGADKVVEFWEAVLTRLHIFKAKACLKDAKMLHKHLQRLEEREVGEENLDKPSDLQPEEESEPDANERIEKIPMAEEEAEEAGSFSPGLIHGYEHEEVMDPEEDRAILKRKRMAVSEELNRRVKEAMASKPAPPPEDIDMKTAMKAESHGCQGGR